MKIINGTTFPNAIMFEETNGNITTIGIADENGGYVVAVSPTAKNIGSFSSDYTEKNWTEVPAYSSQIHFQISPAPSTKPKDDSKPDTLPDTLVDSKPKELKVALVVGIDKYANPRLNLAGCVNDSNKMAELFKSAGYVVLLLQNELAKADDIRKAIRTIIKIEDLSKMIYYQASHGSQILDVNGDELDGSDEILCCHDFSFDKPSSYILDDNLGKMLSELPKNTRLTTIFDTCCSGTSNREIVVSRTRTVGNMDLRGADIKCVKRLVNTVSGRKNSIHIGATQDDKVSYEFKASSEAGVSGAFTSALHKALTEKIDSTPTELDHKIQACLDKWNIKQTIQISGDISNLSEPLL